jgi:hypothetical protein
MGKKKTKVKWLIKGLKNKIKETSRKKSIQTK